MIASRFLLKNDPDVPERSSDIAILKSYPTSAQRWVSISKPPPCNYGAEAYQKKFEFAFSVPGIESNLPGK